MLAGKQVLVTGGTGFIGGRLIEKLILEHQANVKVLVRNFSRASRIARFNIPMISGDITEPNIIEEATKGCDIIFHCAYNFLGTLKESEEVNLQGTKNIIKAALKENSKMVHVSTIDVYGSSQLPTIDETTPKQPGNDIYALTKYKIEQLVLESYQQQGLLVSVLQPTIVYGPFCRPWTITPTQQMRTGKIVIPQEKGICNAVYIDDVIDALILAATKEEAVGETFLISAEEPITWQEFYQAYQQILSVSGLIIMPKEQILSKQKNTHKVSFPRQITNFLRDPSVLPKLLEIPTVENTRRLARQVLPEDFRQVFMETVTGTTYGEREEMRRNLKVQTAAPVEEPLYFPNSKRLELLTSEAKVRIEKAQKYLDYYPKFTFQKGIDLTAQYIKWASL